MEIRHFSFPNSVFAKFRPDSEHLLEQCFLTDTKQWKIQRFVKDEVQQQNIIAIVRKHYGTLKNQFLRLICCKSYPVIDWLDFVQECTNWKMIDMDLTSSDIDRIFIATNYEVSDLE